jgi:8-oxo-dGTP pyrophosphatase MutT (NUDIX family)
MRGREATLRRRSVIRQNSSMEPTEPRTAATVVVARPGPEGVEVLLLRRSAGSRFAPGYVVFPGGVVEPEDERRAGAWFGDRTERVRAGAVRELAEEAGLVLTAEGLHPAGGSSVDEMVAAAPPALDDLHEMARWLAPEFLEVRYDAWFYSVVAPPETTATPDMGEIDLAWWERPVDALARHPLWTALMWPTFRTLEALVGCSSVEDVARLRVEQEPPPLSPLARTTSPEYRG